MYLRCDPDRIAFENALEAAERATDVPLKLREAFKNQATAAIEKLKEARDDGFEEEEEFETKRKTGVLERARAAFPAGSRHDACSSFSSKVSLEYGGPEVGRIAVAAQVGHVNKHGLDFLADFLSCRISIPEK